MLPHQDIEKPLIIQIFGKDPVMFAKAAQIIETYGVAGIDVNMGCPSFVDELPGETMQTEPRAIEDLKTYLRNLVLWLAPVGKVNI